MSLPKKFLLLLPLSIACFAPVRFAMAAPVTAKVIILRGKAMALQPNKQKAIPISKGDSISQGETVATGPRSFLKLLYVDGTQMNLGPNSRIKIEQNSDKNKAGIIKLISGKIRTKVSKDLLKRQERDNTKLFIQTRTASMGVRGTDFDVVFNQQNGLTSLITYEGTVAFARNQSTEYDRTSPNEALSRSNVVVVQRGEYSGSVPNRSEASLPVKISPVQFHALRAGSNLADLQRNSAEQTTSNTLQNPLPPGVDARLLHADSVRLETRIESLVGTDTIRDVKERVETERERDRPPPEGINEGASRYAPPAGGMVDLKTGIYVSPPPGSAFDKNAGVYLPPPTVGTVNPRTGDYTPPKGIDLHPTRGFVVIADTSASRRRGKRTDGDPSSQTDSDPNVVAIPGVGDGNTNAKDKEYYGGAEFAPPPTELNFEVLGDGVVPPPGGFGNFSRNRTAPLPDGPVEDPYCPDCDQQNPNQNNSGNEQNNPTPNNTLIIRVNPT